mgnify:CR=1 FL=1|jgi:hypothetical protein
MIGLDDADDFTYELACLVRRHNLAIVPDECGELTIIKIHGEDFIAPYVNEILDNTARE